MTVNPSFLHKTFCLFVTLREEHGWGVQEWDVEGGCCVSEGGVNRRLEETAW